MGEVTKTLKDESTSLLNNIVEAMSNKRFYEAGFIIDEALNELHNAIEGTGSSGLVNMALMRRQVPIKSGEKYNYLKWVEAELLELRSRLGTTSYECEHEWRLKRHKGGFGEWFYVICDKCLSEVTMGTDCPFSEPEFKKLMAKYNINGSYFGNTNKIIKAMPKTEEFITFLKLRGESDLV